MASHTINGQPWPTGTPVNVYPADAQPSGHEGVPMGSPVDSATVAGSSVTFSALQEGRRYVAYATGKTVLFLVQPGSVDLLAPIRGEDARELHELLEQGFEGLDHTTAVSQRRPLSTIVQVEPGSTVLGKDLAGGTLRVFTTASGSTLLNPVTANSSGLISGFVDAPDFDLYVTPPSGGAYTQKVRTSPPGVFHVNSYGAIPYYTNLGPAGTYESSSAAIQAADDAAQAAHYYGAMVEFGSSFYVVDTPIGRNDLVKWRGQGRLATNLWKQKNVDSPIVLDTGIGRYDIEAMGFRCLDPASHAAPFALVDFQPYLTHVRDVYVDQLPLVRGSSGIVTRYPADRNTFENITGVGSAVAGGDGGVGLRLLGPTNSRIVGRGALEQFRVGVLIDSRGYSGLSQSYISTSFESVTGPKPSFSIALLGTSGVEISGCYMLLAHIMLDRESRGNFIHANKRIGANIYDATGDNFYGGDAGEMPRPQDGRRLSVFFPSSLARDPDLSHRSLAGHTAVGGGSLTKQDKLGPSVRVRDRSGRLPLQIGGGAGKGDYITPIPVTAGVSYLIRQRWWSDAVGAGLGQAQLKLIDDATVATLYDSGVVTRTGSNAEWYEDIIETVWECPAGTTLIRPQLSSPDAGLLYRAALDVIRLPNLNGGMEGAYVGGVAPGWTGAGTGTPAEVASPVRSGSKAQRITVAAGQNYTIAQDIGAALTAGDPSALYLLRADVRFESGGRTIAAIGFGTNDLFTSAGYQARARSWGVLEGTWEPLSMIVKPSTLLSLLIGLESDDTVSGSAVFDHVYALPLKEEFALKTTWTPEIDLTAAPRTVLLAAPTIDRRLRRLAAVCTQAPTAPAAPCTIQVGIPGTATYYGGTTVAIGATTAVGTVVEMHGITPPAHTDIRAGTPMVVTSSAATPAAGRWQVLAEIE